MNIILLTAIVFTVALVHGQPCRDKSSNNAYGTFVQRHILQNGFKRSDLRAWERYLVNSGLCGRFPVQSFIDAAENDVQQICSQAGRRVEGKTAGNLCISKSDMQVYDVFSVKIKNCCRVTSVTPRRQKVVVACNKVANQCRPVHYQRYNNQQPSNNRCV